jgi:hypothetical protein
MARQEAVPAPSVKSILLSSITDNLQSITINRLNAVSQGSSYTRTNTLGSTWHDNLSLSFTIQFQSHDAARYFFNCGGQLGVSSYHPTTAGNTINRLMNEICTDMGTIWLSSPTSNTTAQLSGANYTGVYKAGGAISGGSTTVTGYGFHSWNSTPTTVHTQQGTYSYRGHGPARPNTYGTYFYANSATSRVKISYNGGGTVTIAVEFTGLTNITVSSGTSITLTVRPPSSNLAASWGTISIS